MKNPIAKYLMCAYAYYELDKPLIEDFEFDQLAKDILENWNNIQHMHKHLLNKDMLIGLAIVNPTYFFCMMIGAMKKISVSISIILGTILGPVVFLFSAEWSLLFAGLIAGSVGFLFGGNNDK